MFGRMSGGWLVAAACLLGGASAFADTVTATKTYAYHDKDVGPLRLQHVVLHVDTVKVDALAGQLRDHYHVSFDIKAIDPTSEETGFDAYFLIYDSAGRQLEIVQKVEEAVFKQQDCPFVADTADLLATGAAVGAMDVQMTTNVVRHHSQTPLTPAP